MSGIPVGKRVLVENVLFSTPSPTTRIGLQRRGCQSSFLAPGEDMLHWPTPSFGGRSGLAKMHIHGTIHIDTRTQCVIHYTITAYHALLDCELIDEET